MAKQDSRVTRSGPAKTKTPKAPLTKDDLLTLAGLLKRLSESIYHIAVQLEAMRLRLEELERRTAPSASPESEASGGLPTQAET